MSGTYPSTTGTTSPIYIPTADKPEVVTPGENYFLVKIAGAQAAYFGPIWEKISKLVILSQVAVNHPALGDASLRAIQRSRAIARNQAELLGLSPNLIGPMPATMTSVGISIEFILDIHNRLNDLAGLINDDAFVAAVSLAPGGAAVAKTLSGVSQKLINTLFTSDERKPILQFSGDFNIPTHDLKAGYYAIIGTRDEKRPLPSPMPALSVINNELIVGGGACKQWSYVLLEVKAFPARTRDLNEGAVWSEKLRQAEAAAERASRFGIASKEKESEWKGCESLLNEARMLILSDPNYLRREADDIIKTVYAACGKEVYGDAFPTRGAAISKGGEATTPASVDDAASRRLLGIAEDEDLEATRKRYARQVFEARKILDGDT